MKKSLTDTSNFCNPVEGNKYSAPGTGNYSLNGYILYKIKKVGR